VTFLAAPCWLCSGVFVLVLSRLISSIADCLGYKVKDSLGVAEALDRLGVAACWVAVPLELLSSEAAEASLDSSLAAVRL
jgi:hypothetical protein